MTHTKTNLEILAEEINNEITFGTFRATTSWERGYFGLDHEILVVSIEGKSTDWLISKTENDGEYALAARSHEMKNVWHYGRYSTYDLWEKVVD